MTQNKPSREFLERSELIKLQGKTDLVKHKNVMKELQFRKDNDILHHEMELERGRIKNAEIRKMQDRKASYRSMEENQRFMEDTAKNEHKG